MTSFLPRAPMRRTAVPALATLALATLTPTLAHAQTQDLFMSDLTTNSILRYSGTGPGTFSTTATTFATGLASPGGLTFDAKGNLFAASGGDGTPGAGSITEFISMGVGTFAAGKIVETGLTQPSGLAFSAGGDLFAAGRGSITEFASTGVGTLTAGKTFATYPSEPLGLAFDTKDDLFADSVAGENTTVFVSTGVGTFAAGKTFAGASTEETGLTFDVHGDLFIADASGTIGEYTFNPIASTFGTRTNVAQAPNGAGGLAFDAQGDLFVAGPNAGGGATKFALDSVTDTFGPGESFGGGGAAGTSFLAFGPSVPAAVPEASTTVSLGLLLALGMGGLGVVARKKRRAQRYPALEVLGYCYVRFAPRLNTIGV